MTDKLHNLGRRNQMLRKRGLSATFGLLVLAACGFDRILTASDAFAWSSGACPAKMRNRKIVWDGILPRASVRRQQSQSLDNVQQQPQLREELSDQRYSTSDWFHLIKSIRKSTILRDIQGPVFTIFAWASFVSLVHRILKTTWPAAATYMCIPSYPHSMVNNALGLLLVFRTNSAYQRFTEGRKIWEQVLSASRNLSRLCNLYCPDMGMERKLRMARLLGAFPYLLADHIQVETKERKPKRGMQSAYGNHFAESEGMEIIDSNDLPWALFSPDMRAECAVAKNRPTWVCDQLSEEVMQIKYSDNFTSRERSTFLSKIDKLSKAVGECERITQTAVPQNYARHALRSLTIWLATLPFALVRELGLLTGPVAGVTSWLMFGVYQIGAFIQDPFQGSLKVQTLCDSIYSDVMYLDDFKNPRETAYQDSDADDASVLLKSNHQQQLDQQQVKPEASEQSPNMEPKTRQSSDEMMP